MYTSIVSAFALAAVLVDQAESRNTEASAGLLKAERYRWSCRGQSLSIAVTDSGGSGPAWLLLPALSTISSRHEWRAYSEGVIAASRARGDGDQPPRFISVDWPGFGDSDRPRLPYSAALLAQFLTDVRRDCCPDDCGLIAAGHGAGIALLAAQSQGLAFREWVLVAPTWRGPLPTMARRRSRTFPVIRGLVEAPLIGPLLYRLNTTRSVLGWMSRRHVYVDGPGLTPAGLNHRQRIARHPGARFASSAFVTGGLDPYEDPEGWIAAASFLGQPLTVVVADQSPPQSLAQMQALAAVADRQLHLSGRLGAHEEFGRELAEMLS
jgi:pimeloyl-ACP methyl ester carboxylesterase